LFYLLFERGKKRKRGCAPLGHPFKRGREFERGRSPLSSKLPSPAMNIFIHRLMHPAGEGTQG
jgi:hypothetical protein